MREGTQMIIDITINPAFGGRRDFQKACGYFHWLRTSGKSEWLDSFGDLLVTLLSEWADESQRGVAVESVC